MEKNRGFRFFGILLVLVVVLGIFFVMAASYNQAPTTASAGDKVKMLIFDVVSAGDTVNSFTNITVDNLGNASVGNITNVTISNGTWVKSNSSFSAFPVLLTVGELVADTETHNYTINFTLSSSATYGVGIQANVTARSIEANLTVDAAPFNSTETLVAETTDPTASASCSPVDVYVAGNFPCTCTGTDSGASASGVSTSVGSSTAPDGISTPLTEGAFTYTCSVTDNAGNSASDTATYNVLHVGGGSSKKPTLPQNIHSWSKITPGVATIMKNFDSEIGIKEIQIEVNNEAQNVKITVTKHDGKPAAVSVSKEGDVYQYMEINTQNFGSKLSKAIVNFRVEKSWLSNNGFDTDEIVVSKFDEVNDRWNELRTTYAGSEGDMELYSVELTGFSFFAISEKTGEGAGTVGEDGVIVDGTTGEQKISWAWLWVLIAVLVLVGMGWKIKAMKR